MNFLDQMDSTSVESISSVPTESTNPYEYSTRITRLLNNISTASNTGIRRIYQSFSNEIATLQQTHRESIQENAQSEDNNIRNILPSTAPILTDNEINEGAAINDTPNERWGDNIYHSKQKGSCRLYFQNVHGLRLSDRTDGKFHDCLNVMKYYDVDIFGFVETCVNWNNRRLGQKVNQIARQCFAHFHVDHTYTTFQTDSDYLPGGVLQATTGSWTCRLQRKLLDPYKMGRWIGGQYVLNENQSLYIISLYRVYKDATIGVNSSYTQQLLALRSRFGPDAVLNPRKQVLVDLSQYIEELHVGPHDHILIMTDNNEVIGEDMYGLQQMMQRLKLIDLFTSYHGKDCNIATHLRSENRRIDYIVGTESLLPHITACGYLPFAKGIESDHRGLFIDFGSTLTSGELTLRSPPLRKIGFTTSKNEVYQYKQYIADQFSSHDIPIRAQQLYDRACPELDDDPTFLTELNNLDREITDIVLTAERKCCTRKPAFSWSIDIHQASLLVKYWQLQYHNRKARKDIRVSLQKIYDQLSQEGQVSIDLADKTRIRCNLRLAKKARKELYRPHRQRRTDQLERYHQHNAAYSGKTVDAERAQYINRRSDDRLFKYLRTVYPKVRGKGITYIEVPDCDRQGNPTYDPQEAMTWKMIHDPREMTKALLQRNISHFGQASKSPFASSFFQQEFGYHGTNASAQKLIQEQDITDGVRQESQAHNGAKAILEKLSDRLNLAPISDTISFDEFWMAFKKWDERTSTSPSNRHLGHYRSLMISDGHDDQYTDDNPNPSQLIKQVYYHIAMAALNSANTLDRWARSSTMMLEKTPGQPRIHRLRVIHIYEADYNLLLKLLWARKLVRHSHKLQALHTAQAGSRPDHRCIDVVLRKEMNYQYSWFTRTPLATVDNDAKACYDRILCNLAMMVSQYHGMSHRACRFHSKTLERMKFTLRTAGGDSEEFYQHTAGQPIHGSGQGSCASPSLWLHISSILLQIHDRLANGMTCHDVAQGPLVRISAEGFVDDISLFLNNPYLHMMALDMIYDAVRHDINVWQDLLAGSGGKLELEKCFYYILAWKFNKFGDALPQTIEDLCQEEQRCVDITDPDSQCQVSLQMKEYHESHKTLGVLKNISGDERDQVKVLMEKSQKMATQTALGQLTRFQARRAYAAIYIPAMTYSLVATSIQEGDLYAVQAKALKQFLPAMGYEPTFPRAIVHGPRQFGGINLGYLYTEMCIAKIGAMISHIQADTALGKIMRLNINWLQVHSGLSTAVLQGGPPITYLSTNWFLHLRDFLYSINGSIIIPSQWKITLERTGDEAIMDRIAFSNEYTTAEKRVFNNWRLFFQASTLSDLVEPTGDIIQSVYWNPQNSYSLGSIHYKRKSRHNWPIQQAPDLSTFTIWKRILKQSFQISSAGVLSKKLGSWKVSPQQSKNRWVAYLHTRTNDLYLHHDSGTFMVYNRMVSDSSRNLYAYDHRPDDMVEELSSECVPVQVRESHGQAYYIIPRHIVSPNTNPRRTSFNIDFDQHLEQLPQWRRDLLLHWQTLPVTQLVESYLNYNCILVASDGSFINDTKKGAFGVVVGDPQLQLMTVMGTAPGNPALHSAFRSELYGILAACVLIIEVTKFCQLPRQNDHAIQFNVDNQGAIDRIERHRRYPCHLGEYMAADMDSIEKQILHELQELEILGYTIRQFRHVKSHQDETMDFSLLSREAQLNTLADRLAGQMQQNTYIQISYSPLPTTEAQLVINKEYITSKYKESIRTAFHTQDLREYYSEKFQWNDETIDNIWWEVFDRSIKKLSHSDRQRIQKYNIRRLPTNNRTKLFFPHQTDLCGQCGTVETNDHLIQCIHCTSARQSCRTEWKVRLLEYLSNDHTPKPVCQAIMGAVLSWIDGKQTLPIRSVVPNASNDLIAAYESQTDIGWDNLLRGKFSMWWEPLISDHIQRHSDISKTITAAKWASDLLTELWTGILQLWDVRNQEVHGSDQNTRQSHEHSKWLREAEFLQHQAAQICGPDTAWFSKSKEDLEKYSVYSLKAWVRNARTIVRIRYQEQQRQLLSSEADPRDISRVYQYPSQVTRQSVNMEDGRETVNPNGPADCNTSGRT